MASKKLDGKPGFECQDCGRLEDVKAAGEAPYPRACRVCGGPNFGAINGHEPRGQAITGRTIDVSADDTMTTTDQA